jgi:hypothetical protein
LEAHFGEAPDVAKAILLCWAFCISQANLHGNVACWGAWDLSGKQSVIGTSGRPLHSADLASVPLVTADKPD